MWVNLIMDTFAALALGIFTARLDSYLTNIYFDVITNTMVATDAPSPYVLERRPDPKSAPLITLTMWKMIIGQAIYQLIVTLILNFEGQYIFPKWNNGHMQTVDFNTFVRLHADIQPVQASNGVFLLVNSLAIY
jgi:Ca2+-transporting ATPase